ncbi:hypothetical protein [Chitinophaga cymbidii]|uniref:Uncharacterized protein n=1 Tax=Chitinophaga cymbidii TaxID=1096750 RepID=A0A512RIP1_9BACT|nr:hypothetical protein [Chitinophaga cymbidii]GEP95540.1 hypothetical protein CCY01nite_18000 [Chitinophaga cymbidii]
MEQLPNMIPKGLLIEWHAVASKELEGLKINYIAKKVGYNFRTVQRLLELDGTVFNASLIRAINKLRADIKREAEALTA